MIKAFSLTLSNIFGSHQTLASYRVRKPAAAKAVQPGFAVLSYVLAGLSAVCLMSYLLGVNSYTSTGYEISKMQNSLRLLAEENRVLSLRYSEASSLAAVQNNIASAMFVPVSSARFVQVSQYSQR